MSDKVTNVKKFYETPVQDDKTRFEIWETGQCIGNSMTPSIAYEEYRQDLVKFLNELLTYTEGDNVVSCGCGNAFIESLLSKQHPNLLATDICESAVHLATSKGLRSRILDVSKQFDLNDNAYDMSFSEGLIGHLLDENLSIEHFIKENKRILKEQGFIFIGNESASNGEDLEFIERADFYFTSPQYLESALKKEGFEAVQSRLIPYERPGEGTKYRTWTWGFKPRKKTCRPDFKNISEYKSMPGVSIVPFFDPAPFSYMVLKPDVLMTPHTHPYTQHTFYLINGKLEVNIDGNKITLECVHQIPDEITDDFLNMLPQIQIFPGQSHGVQNISNQDTTWLCYENPPHK
jgi:SAM-dependent methyltransferase